MSKEITALLEKFDEQVAIVESERDSCTTNKSASRRLRGATSAIEKIGKELRKATIANDKA